MKDATSKKASVSESSLLTHTIVPEDAAVMTAMRAAVLPFKGELQGIAAREPFDEIMERVSPPEGHSIPTRLAAYPAYSASQATLVPAMRFSTCTAAGSTGDRRTRTEIWWATSPQEPEPRHSYQITGSPQNIPSPPP